MCPFYIEENAKIKGWEEKYHFIYLSSICLWFAERKSKPNCCVSAEHLSWKRKKKTNRCVGSNTRKEMEGRERRGRYRHGWLASPAVFVCMKKIGGVKGLSLRGFSVVYPHRGSRKSKKKKPQKTGHMRVFINHALLFFSCPLLPLLRLPGTPRLRGRRLLQSGGSPAEMCYEVPAPSASPDQR